MFACQIKSRKQRSAEKKSPWLRFSFCALTFCSSLLLSPTAAADDTFQLLKTYTKMPEAPPVKSFALVTDHHQVTFVPPHDSIVRLDRDKEEVCISFQDDRCLIKLQLSTNSPSFVSPAYCEHLRKLVQARFPEAEVGPATVCYNSCSTGRSFDIQRFTVYKTKLITRLVFVPFRDGMLEISLSAADTKFNAQQFALSGMLNSLLVEKPNPDALSLRKD
jgi:hypothetical protein